MNLCAKLEDFKLKSGHAKSAQALLEREIVMELNKPADGQSPAQRSDGSPFRLTWNLSERK